VVPLRGGRPLKYRQIAADLAAMIESGELAAGSVLPSEPQLTRTYGVTQKTVREALQVLRSEGLIRTERGRASFVRRPAEQAHTHTRALVKATGRYRDTDNDHAAGYSLVEQPATYEMPATPALARAFGIVEGTPIFGYDRLLANRAGTRLFRVTYLPVPVAAHHDDLTDNAFRESGTLYDLLGDITGGPLEFTETVTARLPSPDDAATLQIPAGTVMLVTRRTITDPDGGQVFAIEETRLAADDTQLSYRLHPTARRTLPD
jgi:GntR family transcriptional regulator